MARKGSIPPRSAKVNAGLVGRKVTDQLNVGTKAERAEKKAKVERAERAKRSRGGQDERMMMAEAAVITKMVEGTELLQNGEKGNKTVAAKMNKVMWGDKYWLRGSTATSTIFNKAHRVDATIAEDYNTLSIWRRMVIREPDIEDLLNEIWGLRSRETEREEEREQKRARQKAEWEERGPIRNKNEG